MNKRPYPHSSTAKRTYVTKDNNLEEALRMFGASPQGVLESKPHVYIAGKIDKNDFRQTLVPNLREHHPENDFINCESFVYTGPFFISCDHGCFHGPNSHGALPEKTTNARLRVADDCISAIKDSDIVFSYITSKDCFGTIMEIGAAIALNKHIVICYSPELQDIDDLWLTNIHASGIYQDVPQDALLDLLNAEIKKFNALEGRRK